MARSKKPPSQKEPARPRAKWNAVCDATLVEVLCGERDKGFQTSNGNWHACAWAEAEKKLAGTELQSGGVAKNARNCQDRWTAVSLRSLTPILSHLP
jgi:hypothetical protein